MLNHDADEIREFWEGVEKELGEKVLLSSLGQSLSPVEALSPPLWGLFYLSSSFLCFRHFPQENWFSALLGQRRASKNEKVTSLVVKRSAIIRIEVLSPATWWQKLLTSRQRSVVVEYQNGQDSKTEFRFTLETKHDEFIDALRL
jgi:hypothetical protein